MLHKKVELCKDKINNIFTLLNRNIRIYFSGKKAQINSFFLKDAIS